MRQCHWHLFRVPGFDSLFEGWPSDLSTPSDAQVRYALFEEDINYNFGMGNMHFAQMKQASHFWCQLGALCFVKDQYSLFSNSTFFIIS